MTRRGLFISLLIAPFARFLPKPKPELGISIKLVRQFDIQKVWFHRDAFMMAAIDLPAPMHRRIKMDGYLSRYPASRLPL